MLVCIGCQAASQITASITVTNATTNGMTFTVNGSTRTLTNQVFNSANQVLTNSDVTGCGSKTNLFNQIGLNLFSQVIPLDTGSNSFQLIGQCGNPLVVTASAGWASVSYSTQVCFSATPVEVPFDNYYSVAATRTNTASQLALDIDKYDTNGTFLDLTRTQTATGRKTLNNTNNSISGTFNGNLNDQLGVPMIGRYSGDTVISDSNSVARVDISTDTTTISGSGASQAVIGPDYLFFGGGGGLGNFYTDASITKIGDQHGTNRFYADGTTVQLNNVVGDPVFQADTDSTRIYDTAGNIQVIITTTGMVTTNLTVKSNLTVNANVVISGNASITGLTTNQSWKGTNNFTADSDIAFVRKSVSSLANGANAAIPIGTNVFVEVSGPSGSFSIDGIANGRDGKLIYLVNQTGFQMTINNESGTDPTAANRIRTLGSAGNTVLTNAAVTLIYSGAVSRWLVISHNP